MPDEAAAAADEVPLLSPIGGELVAPHSHRRFCGDDPFLSAEVLLNAI
jgi:hypothetical protein